jgi:cation diffusion facilitator family transporter
MPQAGPSAPGRSPRAYIVLSIGTAVATMGLKFGAYLLTGSVGLLSDAIESLINLTAALVAFWALTVARRPPDSEHPFGHSKAEYFSSATESLLIMAAAAGIAAVAWNRLIHPRPLELLTVGAGISAAAALINAITAFILLRAGRRLRSITLRADALHLFTDVWTSVGVIIAVVLVHLTGWLALDPIVAFVVAANIVWMAVRLLRETAAGVLDAALSQPEQAAISAVLAEYERQGVAFHALRTRLAGQRRFIELHVLVPGSWTVQRGHDLCEDIERRIIEALPTSTVLTHLEPVEDSASWGDTALDRTA